MLPQKMFKNLHAVMAILVIFEQFLGKFCVNFLNLILSTCFAKHDAFYWHIFDYACLGRNTYCYRRGSKL